MPRAAQGIAGSIHDRSDVSEFKQHEIGPNASSPYNHRGTVVVAFAWLAFYAIVAIHHLIVAGNANVSKHLTGPNNTGYLLVDFGKGQLNRIDFTDIETIT